MEFNFVPDQRFECTGCARCCRSWSVAVDLHCQQQVRGSPLELRVIQATGQEPLQERTSGLVTAAKRAGSCIFLDSRDLCSIHAELGGASKPIGCRQFPFFIQPTPDGVFVGTSYFCTSIRQNSGRPLEEYSSEIQEILDCSSPRTLGLEPLVLAGDHRLSWLEYRRLEEYLWEQLALEAPDLSLGRIVWGLCRLVGGQSSLQHVLSDQVGDPTPAWRGLEITFLAGLIARVEVEPEDTPALLQGLFEGRTVTLPHSGWTGNVSEVQAAMAQGTPDWLESEIARYLKSLIFRKFPALNRPVLENLTVLLLLPRVIRFYAYVGADLRGKSAPEREDYYGALEVCEFTLITHGQEAYAMSESFARFFLDEADRNP